MRAGPILQLMPMGLPHPESPDWLRYRLACTSNRPPSQVQLSGPVCAGQDLPTLYKVAEGQPGKANSSFLSNHPRCFGCQLPNLLGPAGKEVRIRWHSDMSRHVQRHLHLHPPATVQVQEQRPPACRSPDLQP